MWRRPHGQIGRRHLRKTVAVSALHDMTQFETSAWVDKTGGDSKSVRFVELKYTEMATALEQGRADAAV